MTEVRLVIAVPTAGTCRMGFAYSIAGLISKVAAHGIPTMPEATISMKMDVVESSNWITNRESLVKRAIEADMTHLLFLDDDMTFEPQVLEIMLGRRQKIITTNYLIKTEARDSFVAVGLDGKRKPTTEKSTGIEPIAYSGFGVSLFEVEVFKSVTQPWFMPQYIAGTGEYTTEDNPFYQACREAGHTVYLDHDASKLLSHLGASSWHWSQFNG